MATNETARCSRIWHATSHAAWGTAPVAQFWIAVEQPGAWGRNALTESALDPELGARLDQTTSDAGGRAVLVRRPGEHAHLEVDRTILVAVGVQANPLLGRRSVAADALPRALDDLIAELDACREGRLPTGFEPAGAALLVCSNGRRDRCCAIEARPVIGALDERASGQVWESSHLNGHRFAPTAVALPTAQMVAWIDADQGAEVLAAAVAGGLWLGGRAHERGRTHLERGVQAVDVTLRERIAETRPSALTYAFDPQLTGADAVDLVGREAWVEAAHTDGRRWRFRVGATAGNDLPESCGKAAVAVADWWVGEGADV